ncbi:MAG: HD domain-containing protein [Blastocatellia bacterium]|nr:HD domain-containing protein [Blastocatellia bacterium]
MDKKPQRNKILYTVLAVVLMVGVLPVIFFGWQMVGFMRETLRGNEQRFQLGAVEDKAKQISLYVEKYKEITASLATGVEISGGVSVNIEQISRSMLRQEMFGKAIRSDNNLCALALKTLSSSSDSILALDSSKISEEEMGFYAEEALENLRQTKQTYVSMPMLIKSSSISAIVIAVPVADIGSEPGGAVVAIVGLEPVFSFVAQKSVGLLSTDEMILSGRTILFVVNNSGRIIAHPDRQIVFANKDMRSLKIVEDWISEGLKAKITAAVPFEIEQDGKKIQMLGAYTTADIATGKELGVIAMVNEDAAYPSVGQMIAKTLIVSIVTVVVALVVGSFLAFRITRPIEILALGAQAVAAGDFARRIRVRTSNEIGQLAEDFNTMADRIQQYINELRRAAEDNRMLFIGSVRALAEAIDGKDTYTRGHSERVMKYSVLIAQHMGLSDEEIEDIRIAGVLHDVGKIGIDDKILKKPAALTDDEYRIMKQHPQIGAKIMSEIPQMKKYIPGMFYHHECLDGHGYPLGLRGDQIPMMARIIAVADVFDAMTTNRPYQRAMETEFALERIKTFVGTRYDGQVVDALIESYRDGKLDEVLQSYAATATAV